MSATETPRSSLIKQLNLMMGGQMVEVEADPEHYNLAIDLALSRYRQRSDGASQENFFFLTLELDKNVYTLPSDIQTVVSIHRRGVGVPGTSGINFDPFTSAVTNHFLLQWGQTGGLATWELFGEYKETLGRLFASDISFNFNNYTHELTIIRRPAGTETVMLSVRQMKPEDEIIGSIQSSPWIRDYALAQLKFVVGEARGKYKGLAGPGGNIQLNGEDLKAEAKAEMERLENELLNFNTSDSGWPFIIG